MGVEQGGEQSKAGNLINLKGKDRVAAYKFESGHQGEPQRLSKWFGGNEETGEQKTLLESV